MSRKLVLELSENVYKKLRKVAEISGQSPRDWIKKWLEMQLSYKFPEKGRKAKSAELRRHFGVWGSIQLITNKSTLI